MLPLLSQPSGAHPYVLLADDSENEAELAQLAFSRAGIVRELVWAQDGEAAFACLQRGASSLPQFLLMDLHMPKLDGLALLARIRSDARLQHLPTIVMSASTQPQDVQRSLSAGANSYVCKPVDFQQFTEQLALLARYWIQVHLGLRR
ncbi:MAG TPA: response regulator [Steroidobacteraceae bacterium]|nr:response regulator [Steroidobacteraceae bacterium]